MRKINLLGIQLMDYTTREALKITNQYLSNGALNTISFVSTQILVEAGEHPEQKTWIEDVDLSICDEPDILHASGNATRNRLKEIEVGEFTKEFIYRLARNRKKIYLLTDSEKRMEQLKTELLAIRDDLLIVGQRIQPELAKGIEALANDINDVVPNVIISRFPYPIQEQMMYENRKMLNADIWIALPEHKLVHTGKRSRYAKILMLFYKKMFKKKLSQYNNEKAE